jgi:uncharacterized protein YecE (DUF72 family)
MQANVRIGPAGWSYPDWDGVVYPRSKPKRFDALEYLSSYFSLIEVNSTFYRIPSLAMCRSWARRTPPAPAFAFSVKAPQDFTHSRAAGHLDEAGSFKRAVSPLADDDKLSCVLVQFPWSFRCDDDSKRHLEAIARALAPLPLAVEVRHGTWAGDEGRRFLESTGHTICGVDQPVIGDSLGPRLYTPGAAGSYFRFHGRNYRQWFRSGAGRDARYDYLYSDEELRSWLQTIRAAAESGAVSVVMNNHFRGQAVANAFELVAMLTGERPRAPSQLRRTYPRLAEATDDDSPGGTLFD